MTKRGQKHTIKCRCILPTLKSRKNPPNHKFVVFSIVTVGYTGRDMVQEKYSQCNNCGVVHRVFELGKSEIVSSREDLSSCLTIEDISFSLPPDVKNILETYKCDLATHEHAKFLIENAVADHIVLTKEEDEERIEGKVLRYDGKSFRIEPFSTQARLK